MMKVCVFLILIFCAAIAEARIRLVQVTAGLNQPVDIVDPGDGSNRLFIVEQAGRIRIFDGNRVLTTPFLNITTSVLCCGEQGLLSLAFHPNYRTNGFFFIYHVNTSGNLVLARYKVSSRPNVANKSSRKVLLTIPHPQFGNHNGGELQFGRDGYLYLSVGDGGSGGDPSNNAQNLNTLLGKILRIDVDQGDPYSIPSSNPFFNQTGVRREIWAYGLRNPWRISFDKLQGHLYIGDVGQGNWEEINFQPANSPGGSNYGWRRMEGRHCFNPSSNCNSGSLKLPIFEYSHAQGCSVTGGFVYRGKAIVSLVGTYLFADYCSGTIWGSKRVSGRWVTNAVLSTDKNISTFGQDQKGELYIADHAGVVFRIAR